MNRPNHKPQTLRIIGGQFRGHKVHFPANQGIRPTPDRIRETVFNWLAPIIHDARCLDLFAGSGALGLEALSRGASHVLFVDQSLAVLENIQNTLCKLYHEDLQIVDRYADFRQAMVPENLSDLNPPFDVVFLDPPFGKDLIAQSIHVIESHQLLSAHAHIYIENEASLNPLPLPQQWHILKNQSAGQVNYYLIQYKKS